MIVVLLLISVLLLLLLLMYSFCVEGSKEDISLSPAFTSYAI